VGWGYTLIKRRAIMNTITVERIELCPTNYAYRATLIDEHHIKDYTPEFGLTEQEAFKKLEKRLERENVPYAK